MNISTFAIKNEQEFKEAVDTLNKLLDLKHHNTFVKKLILITGELIDEYEETHNLNVFEEE